MRTGLAVLLAVGLVLSATGCGSTDTAQDEKETTAAEATVEDTTAEDTRSEEEKYKSSCIDDFDYNKYFRYPDERIGEHICVTMKIVQLLSGGFRGMDINGKIYITLNEAGGPNLQLDDIITVWGTYEGVEEYETTDENHMGFFTIKAEYTEFVDEAIADEFQENFQEDFQEEYQEEFINPADTTEAAVDNPYWDSILLWKSYDTELTDADFAGLTKADLRIARNEIYAAYGRIFTSQDLIDYFNSKSWYLGTVSPDRFSDSVLTKVQKANIEKIKAFEDRAANSGSADYEARGLTFDDPIAVPQKDGIYTYRNINPDEEAVGVEYMQLTVSNGWGSMMLYDTYSASGNVTESGGFYSVNDEAYVTDEEGGISIGFDEYGQYATVIFPWGYEPKFSFVEVSPLN